MEKKETLEGVIRKYVENGLFFGEIVFDVNVRAVDDDSLLHLAAAAGNIDDVKVLLDNGAEVNSIGDMGNTPLHEAIRKKNLAIILLLLKSGADPLVVNEFDRDCYQTAKAIGTEEIVEVIKLAINKES